MMGKQPIMGGHCYVMLGGLWTNSIAQFPTFLEDILHILHILYIFVQCQVLRKQKYNSTKKCFCTHSLQVKIIHTGQGGKHSS